MDVTFDPQSDLVVLCLSNDKGIPIYDTCTLNIEMMYQLMMLTHLLSLFIPHQNECLLCNGSVTKAQ